ncbi:MAG TPA: hypothetical protein VF442_04825 [Sphingobium sp.]
MLGNPILDEIDDAHRRLSPPAQQALEQAHGMIAMPGDPTAMPAPALGGSSAPAQPNPIAMPSANAVPTLPPSSAATAHTAELNRLEGSKSGSGQSHSPFARIPLQIAQGLGSAFLPGLTMSLPSTDLHHQMLVHDARRTVESDQSAAAGAAENRLKGAQAANQETLPEFRETQAELAR